MSLSQEELEYWLAYVDGQYDEVDTEDAEQSLPKSEEAQRLVENVMAVGEWVRQASDAKASAARADSIVGDVMAEVEELGGAKVILLEKERARKALNRQRAKEFSALAAVAAVMAAIWVWPDNRPAQPEMVATGPNLQQPTPPVMSTPAPVAPAPEEPAFASTDDGVAVDTVESQHQVSIFYLPGVADTNASSVVVWIGDDQEGH